MTTQDSPVKFAQTRISYDNLAQLEPSFVKKYKRYFGISQFRLVLTWCMQVKQGYPGISHDLLRLDGFIIRYPILSQVDSGRTQGYDRPFEAGGLRPHSYQY